MGDTIPKYHIYKVWDSDGLYLGVLKYVSSEFRITEEINQIGPGSITVTVAQNGDTAQLPVKMITTEDGKLITTEDGKVLTTEGEPENFAVTGSMIRNGNVVKITEYSEHYPNGIVVFIGSIKRWNVKIGSSEDMSIMLRPLSADLNNYIVKSGEVLHSSLTVQNASDTVYGGLAAGNRRMAYQLPTPSRGMTNISSIILRMSAQNAGAPSTATVRIFNNYSNSPPGGSESANLSKMNNPANALGTATVLVSGTTAQEYTLTFPAPVQLNPLSVLFIEVEASGASGSGINLFYSSTNVYSNGIIVRYTGSTWDYPSYFDGELYYKIYVIPDYTNATLTNFEPSATVATALNNYNSEGGVVTYTEDSLESTGTTVPTYTFRLTPVRQGFEIMLKASPADFYYFVDPGTNILTWKRLSSTPDHLITIGNQVLDLDLSASVEQLKNFTYFTGGKPSGSPTNLLRENSNQASVARFGRELDLLTDINVVTAAVADSFSNNYIDRHDDEEFGTSVVIIDTVENTRLYQVGHTVGIRNSGNKFVDSLVIPITRIVREHDRATLYLGALPIRENDIIQDSQDKILDIQTVDNPNQPS